MTEKECAACEKVRGLTLSEEAWEVAVLNNHHALYQVAQLGLAVANAALSEKDARIAELERAYRQREEALQNLVVLREKERDEAMAALRNLVNAASGMLWHDNRHVVEARRISGGGRAVTASKPSESRCAYIFSHGDRCNGLECEHPFTMHPWAHAFIPPKKEGAE